MGDVFETCTVWEKENAKMLGESWCEKVLMRVKCEKRARGDEEEG